MQSYADKSCDYFAHARREIESLLPEYFDRVLEIGCGSGATLGWLRQAYHTKRTVGVEVVQQAAELARNFVDEVYCLDFERNDLPASGQKFGLILCLDVLEHMVDPWAVVDRLVRQYLELGGTLLVSLPNVRHYSVVLPLLFRGRWKYLEAGLLDRTHLRFFTRGSALDLLSHPDCGSVKCTAMGFEGWSIKRVLNALSLGLFREFVTYQYFLSVRRIH